MLWAAYVGTIDDTDAYEYDLGEYKSSFDLQQSVNMTTRSTRGLKKSKAKKNISTTACRVSKKKSSGTKASKPSVASVAGVASKAGVASAACKGASRDQFESEPGDHIIVNFAASVPINTVLDSLFVEQKHAWHGDCLVPVDEDDEVIEDA